jgi:predicted nucleotidyltransferase
MKLEFDSERLGRFCRERGVAKLELFGSALRDDFRADSDVDLLCTMRPDVKCGLFEWVAIKLAFEEFFGRTVDLVSRPGIEASKNRFRKHAILTTATPIYVEG